MTDHELLELAAKAAGVETEIIANGFKLRTNGRGHIWDPLNDDGDALRLAVQLRLDVRHSHWPNKERYVTAQKVWDPRDSMYYDDGVAYEEDPCAATRRAIARAAAERGRAMK